MSALYIGFEETSSYWALQFFLYFLLVIINRQTSYDCGILHQDYGIKMRFANVNVLENNVWLLLLHKFNGLGFKHPPPDLANVNAWYTMFDPYTESTFIDGTKNSALLRKNRKQLGQIEWETKYCSKTVRRRGNKFIGPFCKLGKCITYLKFWRSYRCGTRFVRPWWLVIFWYLYAYFSFWDAKLCQAGSPGRMF